MVFPFFPPISMKMQSCGLKVMNKQETCWFFLALVAEVDVLQFNILHTQNMLHS